MAKVKFLDENDVQPISFEEIDEIDNTDISGDISDELPEDYEGDITDEDIDNILKS